MFLVTARPSGLKIELVCALCREPMDVDRSWLAFPGDPLRGEGRWVHKGCIDGQALSAFGTSHVTLMDGLEVFRRLAQSEEDRREKQANMI